MLIECDVVTCDHHGMDRVYAVFEGIIDDHPKLLIAQKDQGFLKNFWGFWNYDGDGFYDVADKWHQMSKQEFLMLTSGM